MALIKAIEDGRISYAEKLLDEGADPNQINEYGESALMLAAQQDMPLIVKRLLIKGANPNAIDNLGNTALMLFINSTKNNANTLNINSFEDSFIDTTSTIFKYLLKVSDLTIIKKNGDNPLLIAINSRKWIMAYNLVKIYNKKDILSDQLRVNAISTLITSYRSDEQFTSYVDVRGELIKMLINGFNDDTLNVPDGGINTPDSSGFNLLTLSIVYSVFFISELLVKKGILVSDEAINILKGAIKEYNTSNNNNNNNNSNNNNDNNNKNKNKNNNKNVNKKTNELAEERKLLSLLLRTKELQNIYSKNNNTSDSIALYRAVAIDNYDLTSSLIKDGINPNEQNRLGNTPLYVASYKGNDKIVKLLLDTPKIDVNKANNTGKTPLMVASLKNHLDIVNKLLGVDNIKINNQDDEGFTALHYAAMAGNIGIIKALIATGADKSIKNKEDYMPFRYSKDFETKKLLALPFTDFSSVNHIIYNLEAIKNSNTSNISNKIFIGKNNSESYKKQIYKYLDKKDLCEGINPDYVKSALNNCDSFIVLMKDDEIFGICLIYIKTINEKDVLYIDVICTNLQYIGVGRYLINLVKSMIRKSKMKDIVLCSVSSAIEFYKKMNFVGNNSIKECGSVLKPMRYTLKGGRRRIKTKKRSKRQ